MVEKPARCRHQMAHALRQLVGLGTTVCAADDQSKRLPMAGAQLAQNAKDLQRKLTRGRDGDRTSAVARPPLGAREQLDRRNQKRKRLA